MILQLFERKFWNVLSRDFQILNEVSQIALSSPWTSHVQNVHTTATRNQGEKAKDRLSTCSVVLAGFHIILCRSCPSTGKFSEISSFNYLLPTAAAAQQADTIQTQGGIKTGKTLHLPQCTACFHHARTFKITHPYCFIFPVNYR